MSEATSQDILAALGQTLRDSQLFAQVLLSPAPSGGRKPAVVLNLTDTKYRTDAFSGETWCDLNLTLSIHIQADSPESRLATLEAQCVALLLVDPSMGGRCFLGPFGPALELKQQTSLSKNRPAASRDVKFICRYRIVAGGPWPDVQVDGQSLFSTGPNELTPGTWTREQQRCGAAGIDGEFVLDMGRRSRRLEQVGQLRGSTATDVIAQMAAIQNRHDGQSHTLTDSAGQTYINVLLESVEQTSGLIAGPEISCTYKLIWRQLP